MIQRISTPFQVPFVLTYCSQIYLVWSQFLTTFLHKPHKVRKATYTTVPFNRFVKKPFCGSGTFIYLQCSNYFSPCRFCFGVVAALMPHVCYYYFPLPAFFLVLSLLWQKNSRQVRVSIVVVEIAGFVELTLPFFLIKPHFFRRGSTVPLCS